MTARGTRVAEQEPASENEFLSMTREFRALGDYGASRMRQLTVPGASLASDRHHGQLAIRMD